jgi:hypothetical protein
MIQTETQIVKISRIINATHVQTDIILVLMENVSQSMLIVMITIKLVVHVLHVTKVFQFQTECVSQPLKMTHIARLKIKTQVFVLIVTVDTG